MSDYLHCDWRAGVAPYSGGRVPTICMEIGVKLDTEYRYEHVPQLLQTSHEGKVTILWNQQVQTDRTISNDKLDIIIYDNEKGTCILIMLQFQETEM